MNRLSDAEWACIQYLFSQPGTQKTTGRPAADSRAILDAILWIERTGERWMYLPAHFPPQQTCYARYLNWKRSGLLEQARALLTEASTTARERPALREETDLVETV
jgi:transposase